MNNGSTPRADHRRWKAGLIGFYLSCAGVALGATFAGGGWFFFDSVPWLLFGGCLTVVCSVTCFRSLSTARRAQD